ncbi:hypothetical protein tb265_23060 [Gemmatimonadetes bacterium T265]|nr:hypothetical protein tb265_23060 [Gemmatimonadetes bacterium T265]
MWLRFVIVVLSRPVGLVVELIVVVDVVELPAGGCDGVVCAEAASGTRAIEARVAMYLRIGSPGWVTRPSSVGRACGTAMRIAFHDCRIPHTS